MTQEEPVGIAAPVVQMITQRRWFFLTVCMACECPSGHVNPLVVVWIFTCGAAVGPSPRFPTLWSLLPHTSMNLPSSLVALQHACTSTRPHRPCTNSNIDLQTTQHIQTASIAADRIGIGKDTVDGPACHHPPPRRHLRDPSARGLLLQPLAEAPGTSRRQK